MGRAHLLDHLAAVTGKQPAELAVSLLPRLMESLDRSWNDTRLVSPSPVVRVPVVGLATVDQSPRASIRDVLFALHTWADCAVITDASIQFRSVRVSEQALFFTALLPSPFADALPPLFEVTEGESGRMVVVTMEGVR